MTFEKFHAILLNIIWLWLSGEWRSSNVIMYISCKWEFAQFHTKCHRFLTQHVMILYPLLPSRFGIYVKLHNLTRLHDCGYCVQAMLGLNERCQLPIWAFKMLKNNAVYSLGPRRLFLTYCLFLSLFFRRTITRSKHRKMVKYCTARPASWLTLGTSLRILNNWTFCVSEARLFLRW